MKKVLLLSIVPVLALTMFLIPMIAPANAEARNKETTVAVDVNWERGKSSVSVYTKYTNAVACMVRGYTGWKRAVNAYSRTRKACDYVVRRSLGRRMNRKRKVRVVLKFRNGKKKRLWAAL